LQAKGIKVCAGYALPLCRLPLFLNKAFGPYLLQAAARLDYAKVRCPNCEKICAEQGAWFEQNLFVGTQSDVDGISSAFEKVYKHRSVLSLLKP